MNWDDLKIFLTLARCERLSEAGRQLKIDHSTVARRIKSLEQSLSTQLFERQPSGYFITSSGRELLEHAENIEANVIAAENAVVDKRMQLSGPVRVAAPEGIAAFAIAKAAQQLCDKNPSLKIQLVTNAQRYSLSKREADFLVTVSRPKAGRIKIQKIVDVPLHIYGTRDYLENKPPVNSLEDLKKLSYISYVPELLPEKELDYLSDLSVALDPQLTATSVHVQAAAILNNAGIGIMHDFMAAPHASLVKLLPDEISLTRTLWGVVHEDHQHVERTKVTSEAIVEGIRKLVLQGS
ncbi:MAG: LysR family transcriptional regulator [Rhizobiales bacterium]|nr:LysR family transcriptional regulator [Hyphomicrobiales bacterium]